MKKLNITFLYWNGSRASAYCNIFQELGYYPSDIVVFRNKSDIDDELLEESEEYKYSDVFFDLRMNYSYFNKYSKIVYLDTDNINDNSVIDILSSLDNKFILFSGGGILKSNILNISAKIIHIHPGILPQYRGSTCFYYSILNNMSLGATAFFMEEKLDVGEVICDVRFSINYYIKNNQTKFMDYILDPYMRSTVLQRVLQIYIQYNDIQSKEQVSSNHKPYYVIHPVLRVLAIKQINMFYKSTSSIGVFESKKR